MLIALGVEIELRFALRSTVAEITAIEVSTLATILDFSKHLKMAKMTFWAIAYCPQGLKRAQFRSTIDGFRDNGNRSFDPAGHLGFFKTSQYGQNGILGKLFIALWVEIELRFALRSTVPEITAIEVSTLAAILDFSNHLKMAKMAIWANAYCPQGRNRAPFRSTIDGC